MTESLSLLAVSTSCDQADVLDRVARELLSRRLAACVQISSPVSSLYVWNGDLQTTREHVLTAKTAEPLYAEIEQVIRSLHTYELPEVIAVPISHGSSEYRDWVLSQIECKS